jgi:WD40 repeat protein
MKIINEATTARQLGAPDPHYIYKLVPTSQGFAAISADDSLRFFNDDMQVTDKSHSHTGVKSLVNFDLAGQLVATAGTDGHARLWDLRSKRQCLEITERKS